MSARLADIVSALDSLYDPSWGEDWDAVGLVAGDPDQEVRRILFAIDPVAMVGEEAADVGADLLVTHHPLFLRGVHGVAETTAKGRFVSALIKRGIGLFVAHTNADVADPGVSDALAVAIGLQDVVALSPRPDPLDKVVTFVPVADADKVLDALSAAGAGEIGDYSRCAWTASGIGTFLPGDAANPTIGQRGEIERVDETRIEMVLPRARRSAVVRALLDAHPYEEPAYDVYELATTAGGRGLGRIGELPTAVSLREFADVVARGLPATSAGIRIAGDLDRPVRRVAVCGGAGDSLLATVARVGVDVFVTADLRHHPASEATVEGGPALIDAAHWATEWPWLTDAADRLRAALAASGVSVETRVSRQVTDPWTQTLGREDRQ